MKKIILIFCLFFLCPVSWAEDFLSPLASNWSFYQTPDPQLHYTQIKAHEWQAAEPSQLLRTNPRHGLYGWYKVTFDWQDKPTEHLLLYLQSIRYADETWLNGQKIGGVGTITHPWQFLAGNPQNLARKYAIPSSLLKAQENTLAIKINLGIGEVWGALYPGSVGIGGDVGIGSKSTVNTLYTQQVLKNTIIDTILIVLGVVDIFIIIFLFRRSIHHFYEFWWLLIGSIAMMSGSLLLDYFYVLNILFGISNLLLILSLLSVPFVSAMYFWSIHRNIPKLVVYIVACVWLSLVLLLVLPVMIVDVKNIAWLLWSGLTTLLLLYCLLSAIAGVRKKYVGAGFQLFGLIVFILSIRTQWMPIDLFENRNIVVGSLVLRYSLLFSYFQRINQMSYDYKQLSRKMLSTIEDNKQEIARDLHDDLSQHLSAAKLRLLLYYQGDVENSIGFIKQEIDAAMQSVRELMQGLHPQILAQYPFEEALQREGERLAKLHNVSIQVAISAHLSLEKKTEKHLFRIFQETIHNAIKHGQATAIQVELISKKHKIRLTVTDNGIGLKPQNKQSSPDKRQGFGLVSLHERTALINGQIRMQPNKQQGTIVVVSIPKKIY